MINVMLIGNGFDIQHGINIKFKDFVNSNAFRKGIGKNYSKFFSDTKYNNFSDSSELWSEFEEYLKYTTESNNLKPKYFIKKITILFQKWFKSKKIKLPNKDSFIEKIIIKNKIDFVISLNYTKTPEIYSFNRKTFNINSIKSEWTSFESLKGKYINLHAFDLIERDIHFILGHDESSKIGKNRFILEWSEKNRFNPKKLFLANLLHTDMIKKIITYGYSFGKSDKNINEFFEAVSKKTDVIVYFKDGKKIENMELNDFLIRCF